MPSQQIPADADDFGAGIGQSLQRTGAIMQRVQEQEFALELRFAEMENETRALDASTEYTRRSSEVVNQFRQLNGQQAVDALPGVEKSLVELDREIGKGLRAPGAQRAYKARSSNILTQNMQVSGLHAANQASAASEAAKGAAITAAQSRFATNFGLTNTEPDISDIVSLSAQLAFEKGLPKEAADVFIQKNVGTALGQVIDVRINNGKFDEARAIFEEAKTHKIPGTDIPVFNGEQIVAVGNAIDRGERIQREDDARRDAAADEARREATEKAYDEYVDQIIRDPTKLDIKSVANDPRLVSGEHGAALLRLWQGQMALLKGGADPDANKGPGFWEAFRAVTGPQPTLTDPMQVYQLAGPGRPLTLQGAQAIVNLMNSRNNGARAGNFQAQATTRFFTNMHSQIASPFGGRASAEGEQAYFQFYMDKQNQIKDGLAAGKTLDQLLNPKSADYVGADFKSYLPPNAGDDVVIEEEVAQPTTSIFDWFKWLSFGGGDKFSTQSLDQKVRSGVEGSAEGLGALRSAIEAKQITREQAAEYAQRRGWVRPSAPPPSPITQSVPLATQ